MSQTATVSGKDLDLRILPSNLSSQVSSLPAAHTEFSAWDFTGGREAREDAEDALDAAKTQRLLEQAGIEAFVKLR